jgi:hypothetical protein
VQVREDEILEALDEWLASVFSPQRLENTITLVERSQGADPGEDTTKIALGRSSPTANASSSSTRPLSKRAPTRRSSSNGPTRSSPARGPRTHNSR